MNSVDYPDRFLPPRFRSGSIGKIALRVITPIALVILIVLAYQAYLWFIGNVARHEAAAAGKEVLPVAVPLPVEVQGLAQSAVGASYSADLGGINNADQRRSTCGYLAAELERLNHEFRQPLPPPVIDRIATEIGQLRVQINRYGCAADDAPSSPRSPARRAAPSVDGSRANPV